MTDLTTGQSEKKGLILCLLSALCFSLSPITGKLLFGAGLPWQVVVSCRVMISSILILGFDLLFKRDVFKIKKEHIPYFILNACFFGFISICNYCSLYYIDAAVATILLYSLPLWAVFLSRIVLKEAFTTPKILALILVFTGTLLIIQIAQIQSISADSVTKIFGIPSSIFGIIIGLMSGLLSALYTIWTRKLNAIYPAWTVNSWCFIMAFPIFFAVGAPKIVSVDWTLLQIGAVLLIAVIGLSAYSLYAVSMQYIEASKASLLVSLDPVLSVSMSVFVLGEHLTPFQILGCILVFTGIAFMETGQSLIDKLTKGRKNKKKEINSMKS